MTWIEIILSLLMIGLFIKIAYSMAEEYWDDFE